MYCRTCGSPNDDNAFKCVSCGNIIQDLTAAALAEGPVSNYLVPAILTTVFCCMPFGIPAIVYAAQVNPRLEFGDRAGALAVSAKAKQWTWIAFGLGLVAMSFYAVAALVGAFADRM